MDNKHLQEYRNFFYSCDQNQDGSLSAEEFKSMIRKMGMNLTADEETVLFRSTDKDRSGSITFKEFLDAFVHRKESKIPSVETVTAAFLKADVNKDGFLDQVECLRALKDLGHDLERNSIARIMDLMDKNGDGLVSLMEFCNFMRL